MRLSLIIAAFASMVVFAVSIYLSFFLSVSQNGLGFNGNDLPWIGYLSICVSMLLGIFFSSLYRALSLKDGSIDIGRELVAVFGHASFWRAMSVAPLVFMSLYIVKSGVPGDLPSMLLAFQNGFFWENILKQQGVAR